MGYIERLSSEEKRAIYESNRRYEEEEKKRKEQFEKYKTGIFTEATQVRDRALILAQNSYLDPSVAQFASQLGKYLEDRMKGDDIEEIKRRTEFINQCLNAIASDSIAALKLKLKEEMILPFKGFLTRKLYDIAKNYQLLLVGRPQQINQILRMIPKIILNIIHGYDESMFSLPSISKKNNKVTSASGFLTKNGIYNVNHRSSLSSIIKNRLNSVTRGLSASRVTISSDDKTVTFEFTDEKDCETFIKYAKHTLQLKLVNIKKPIGRLATLEYDVDFKNIFGIASSAPLPLASSSLRVSANYQRAAIPKAEEIKRVPVKSPVPSIVVERKEIKPTITDIEANARAGDRDAQFHLGGHYAKTVKNGKIAAEWFEKAAMQGHKIAQAYLANCYAHGLGVARNNSLANKWFQAAAMQGHLNSQFILAAAYGEDEKKGAKIDKINKIDKDDILAAEWTQKAALQGLAEAQYQMGLLYERGCGVTQDENVAREYFRKAAVQEHKDALKKLADLGLKTTDEEKIVAIPDSEVKLESPHISEGGNGIVYRGMWKSRPVAVKQALKVNPDQKIEFERESNMLVKLRSPYTVHSYGYTLGPNYSIVMEYMAKGSLYDVIHDRTKTLTPEISYRIITQIACGVTFIHSQSIVHRDLKSLNILVDENFRAKISDLGLSKAKKNMELTNQGGVIGTSRWMAPELLQSKAPYTPKADVWSMGIIFWEVYSRQRPFNDIEDSNEVPQAAARGKRDVIPPSCPPKLASLIPFCWLSDAKARPTSKDVVNYLRSSDTEFKPVTVMNPPAKR